MTARTFTTRESKFETSSALETTCDSRRGILAQWQRLRARFYCTVCQTMQLVQSVGGIVQAPEHATYTGCVLECGHFRDISVSVQRTKAVTKAMEQKKQAEQKSLLSDMQSVGTL
jgi:hypothetical protein